MLVAKNKSEHDWIGYVKVVERFNIHLYPPINDLGALIYMAKILESETSTILQTTASNKRHFANGGLQTKDTLLEGPFVLSTLGKYVSYPEIVSFPEIVS